MHEELPCGLERRVAIVERDEKHRRERRQLDGNPENAEVVRHRDEQHREDVGGDQAVKLAPHARVDETARFIAPEIAHPVGAGDEPDEPAQDQHQRRQTVDPQRLAKRRRNGAVEEQARRRQA
jgi:hypothetical protein